MDELPSLVWREGILPRLTLEDISNLRLCSKGVQLAVDEHRGMRRAWCRWYTMKDHLAAAVFHLRNISAARLTETFALACTSGDRGQAEWILQAYPGVEVHQRTFVQVCAQGHLELVQWLHSTLKLPADCWSHRDFYAFRATCGQGHLEVVRWLHAVYDISETNARVRNNEAFRFACENGHLETAQWLTETFRLTTPDARASHDYAMRWSCNNGHLHIAKWLYANFKFTGEQDDGHSLSWRCRSKTNNNEISRWLHETLLIGSAPKPRVHPAELYRWS